MSALQFPISVSCPWCKKGETLADKPADINVSCQCHHCGNFYNIDFKTGRAIRAGPKRKVKQPSRKN
jgi:hypothetical protein